MFPRWASGLSQSTLTPDRDGWIADGAESRVRIRFTPHNAFGIMDHWVELPNGAVVSIPMRLVANGPGTEVLFTLFRQPGMSDHTFAEDEAWVKRDLLALKQLAEA